MPVSSKADEEKIVVIGPENLKAIGFVVFVLLILSMSVAVSLTTVVYNGKFKAQGKGKDPGLMKETDICHENTIDVAVVGAGVSGTYTAWKLSEKYDWDIHLFEASSRVGGRLFSVAMPGIEDFRVDLGGMRYVPSDSPILSRIINVLNLTPRKFTTPTSSETLFYFRGTHLNRTDVINGNVPYVMTEEERKLSVDHHALFSYWNNKIVANDSKSNEDFWKKKCVDGKYAYQKGIYNAFLEVTSRDAIVYGAFKSAYPGHVFSNPNYAPFCDTSYSGLNTGDNPAQRYTVKTGFQSIAEAMVERFQLNNKSKVFLHKKLMSVSHIGELAHLKFQDTNSRKITDICAKNVVLGLPNEALKRVSFFDEDLAETLKPMTSRLKQGPALKFAIVYKKPWWRTAGNGAVFDHMKQDSKHLKYIVTDLPLGVVIDLGEDEKTGKAALLFYTQLWRNIRFWISYMTRGTPHPSQVHSQFFITSDELIQQCHIMMARILNISIGEIPSPESSVSFAWYREPYWTAWHYSKPGYNFKSMPRDILKPVSSKGLYIVGEAFTNISGWVEGALQTADHVLNTYFDVN